MASHDLQYEPDSCVSEFDVSELERFVMWHNIGREDRLFVVDPVYVEHLNLYHGGIPGRDTFAADGRTYKIERFLNWLESGSEDPRAKYDSAHVWSVLTEYLADEEETFLIPIADCTHGDLLCFDLRESPVHTIHLWSRDKSREEEAVTCFVAASFADLLDMLQTPA